MRAAETLPRPNHAPPRSPSPKFQPKVLYNILFTCHYALRLSSIPVCCLAHNLVLHESHHLTWIARSRFSPGPLCYPNDTHLRRLEHHQDSYYHEKYVLSLQALSEQEWHFTLALHLWEDFQQVRATRRHRQGKIWRKYTPK